MISVNANKTLIYNNKIFPCTIGKSGISANKREGDGASPTGVYRLKYGFYRADRLEKPQSFLNFTPLHKTDGWCDDPESPFYNKKVRLPFNAGHEVLWREDCIYDIIIVLSHNDNPPIPGLGSAIFFHLAHDDYRSTEGCVALKLEDMLEVLKTVNPGQEIEFILPDADQK